MPAGSSVRRRGVVGEGASALYESYDDDGGADVEGYDGVAEMTASKERTQEFQAAVRSLRGAQAQFARDPKQRSRPRPDAAALERYAEFMHSARQVSRNVAATYSKLEKLTLLAKKKSLFDDRPAEIQELTYIIKNDLGSLNKQIAELGEMPRGRRHVQSHSSGVVLGLQSRLATMSARFKQVLEVRSENLKRQNTRREQFSKGLPPVRGAAALYEERDRTVGVDIDGVVDHRPGSYGLQKTAQRDFGDDYAAQRAEAMHNIESTVVELGGIFQQLAHMVKEQDEMVARIDSNVEDAELNIEAAHSQILKYFQSVTGNRMLMFKIFGVLIFFFIFFVVFLT